MAESNKNLWAFHQGENAGSQRIVSIDGITQSTERMINVTQFQRGKAKVPVGLTVCAQ